MLEENLVMPMPRKKKLSFAALGAKGGKSRTEAQTLARRQNGLGHKPRYDWSLVPDWSLPSHLIAAAVGCSASAVRKMRGKLRRDG